MHAEFGTLLGDTLYDQHGNEYHVYCVTTDGKSITVYCKLVRGGTVHKFDLGELRYRR